MIPLRPVLALTLAGALVLSACGGDDDSSSDDNIALTPTINVTRTDDPISQLMAEIYGQGLENSGYRVGRKDPVADQGAAIDKLESSSAQLVTDTTGSLLARLIADNGGVAPTTTAAPSTTDPATTDTASTDTATTDTGVTDTSTVDTVDPTVEADTTATAAQMAGIRELLPSDLIVFEPAPIDNGLVVACSTTAIDEHSLATVGDLASGDVTLGGTAAFRDAAAGGLDALNEVYDADVALTVVDDVAAAVVDGSVDCGVLPGLTPSITIDALIVLDDDLSFAVPDRVLPVMTVSAGQPDVQAVLDTINATLTTEVIRSLLVKAEAGGQSYDVLAKQYLASVASDS